MSFGPEDRDRLRHVLLGEEVHHLPHHAEHAGDLLGLQQRRAHVHGDDDLRAAAVADLLDGHVVHQPAVDQLAALAHHGGDRPRHRHAGAHGRREVAVAHRHALAVADVGGDERERDRQLLDVALAEIGAHQLVEEELDLLARHRALAVAQAFPGHAELEPGVEAVVDLLPAQAHRFAPGAVVEHARPVGLGDGFLHLGGRDARDVGAGRQRPHGSARNAVERHAQFLEDLENAKVRAAAGAAAAEDEAHLRASPSRRGPGHRPAGRQAVRPQDTTRKARDRLATFKAMLRCGSWTDFA